MTKTLEHRTLDWGRTWYADALRRQRALVAERIADEVPDTLVFTEHEPVYTLGARPGAARHLLLSEAQLRERGIAVEQTNRGGDITYHGPGQIVGYPIISLGGRRDLHRYLRDLEQVLINAVGTLGLAASRREGQTGIWVGDKRFGLRKIAAIGVAVKSWVTYHGFALNIDPDLDHFAGIVPCGITDGAVSSVQQEIGAEVDIDEARQILGKEFWRVFG